jgi:hypothetical protein
MGNLSVCRATITFQGKIDAVPKWMRLRILFPSISAQLCLPSGMSDVVMIFHADNFLHPAGNSEYFLEYEKLSLHLSSHGFVVISVSRYFGSASSGPWKNATEHYQRDGIVQSTVKWLYNSSFLKGNVSNKISFVMHSAGGNYLETLPLVPLMGKVLSSIVMLTTVYKNPPETYGIPYWTKAYLGLHCSQDLDPASITGAQPGKFGLSQWSGFVVFDTFEKTQGFSKDFVFFQSSPAGHYYQNEPVSKAYLTAFLGFHMKGILAYGEYLKLCQPPGSLLSKQILSLRPEHGEPEGVLDLCNLENQGSFSVSGNSGIDSIVIDAGWKLNEWCQHKTKVAMFRFLSGWANPRLVFSLSVSKNISQYRYLTFRMGQVYDPDYQDPNTPLNVQVGINTFIGGSIVIPARADTLFMGNVKSAIQTFVLPLKDFQATNLSSVKTVFFQFGNNPMPVNRFCMIASMEAWK